MKLKLFVFLIVSLVFVQIVNATIGVGYPFPSQLELKQGESGRFQFEIQSTPEEGVVTCNYNLETPIPLTIVFDEKPLEIPVTGSAIRMPVYATVTAPIDIEPGSYSTSFCVSCAPENAGNPVGALGSYCGITFGVDVVGERTRPNPYIPPKKEKTNPFVFAIVLVMLMGIIILSVIIIKRIVKKS